MGVAYVLLCGALFYLQRYFIYFPEPAFGDGDATALVLPGAAARVLVATQLIDGPRAVIYFGGNAEDVSLSMPGLSAAFPDRAIYAALSELWREFRQTIREGTVRGRLDSLRPGAREVFERRYRGAQPDGPTSPFTLPACGPLRGLCLSRHSTVSRDLRRSNFLTFR